jgi:hypothetical protein
MFCAERFFCSMLARANGTFQEKLLMFDLCRPELGTETIRKPYRLHRIDHSRFRLYSQIVSEGVTHLVSSFTK